MNILSALSVASVAIAGCASGPTTAQRSAYAAAHFGLSPRVAGDQGRHGINRYEQSGGQVERGTTELGASLYHHGEFGFDLGL